PDSGLPIGGLLPEIYVGVRLITDLPTVTKAGALGDAISAAKGVYDAHSVEAVLGGLREVLAAQAHAAPAASVPATTAPRKARQRHLDSSSPRSASPYRVGDARKRAYGFTSRLAAPHPRHADSPP